MQSFPKPDPYAVRPAPPLAHRVCLDLPVHDARRRQAFEVLRAYYAAVEQGLAPAD